MDFLHLLLNGKMDNGEKQANQDAFINDEVQVMVATSAFGMGVDKPNVRLMVHYDISDSLENYVQEAGRAGRDQNLQALENALLCLSKIDAMKLEGGFLVPYSGMEITRLELDNKIRYKADRMFITKYFKGNRNITPDKYNKHF